MEVAAKLSKLDPVQSRTFVVYVLSLSGGGNGMKIRSQHLNWVRSVCSRRCARR